MVGGIEDEGGSVIAAPSETNLMPWPFHQHYHRFPAFNANLSDDPWRHVGPLHVLSVGDWDREEELRRSTRLRTGFDDMQNGPFSITPKVIASGRQWQSYRKQREQEEWERQQLVQRRKANSVLNSNPRGTENQSMEKRSIGSLDVNTCATSRTTEERKGSRTNTRGTVEREYTYGMSQWYNTKSAKGWLSTPSRNMPSRSQKSNPSQHQLQQRKRKQKCGETHDAWLSDPNDDEEDETVNSVVLRGWSSNHSDMKENISPSELPGRRQIHQPRDHQVSPVFVDNRDHDEGSNEASNISENESFGGDDSDQSVDLIDANYLPTQKVQHHRTVAPPGIPQQLASEHPRKQQKSMYVPSLSSNKSNTHADGSTTTQTQPTRAGKLKLRKKRANSHSPRCRQSRPDALPLTGSSTVTPTESTTPLQRRRAIQPVPSFQPIAKGWERRLTQMSLTGFMESKASQREKRK